MRSAGRSVKGAGVRARLTFSGEVEEAPDWALRTIAESLTRWLVEEQAGRTDLQQQRASTIELTELGQVSSFFEIVVEEPGMAGRRFRYLLRARPLSDSDSNFPARDVRYTAEALLVLEWPAHLLSAGDQVSCLIWRQAAAVGPRNAAQDLAQRWLLSELGGAFPRKEIAPKLPQARPTPLLGREEESKTALAVLLPPRVSAGVLSVTAPGGTGKSFFLKHLRQVTEGRVVWASVDHQGLQAEEDALALMARVLTVLAQGLENQGVTMSHFGKELRLFHKGRESDAKPSGFLGHFRKAAETAAGIHPVLGAASAGVAFLASWGEQVQEESEAVARDDALQALTRAFLNDLANWSAKEKSSYVLWRRPVLVFDTYEWLAPLVDVWLRTRLLGDELLAKAGAAVIVAGRDHLFKVDTRWSELAPLLTSLELRPFSKATASLFLSQLKTPEDRFEELYELTKGSPLFLALVAHIGNTEEAVAILSERILEEVPRQHWSDFRRSSLLDSFAPSTLSVLFPEKGEEERRALLDLLRRATFTVASDGGSVFAPAVREVLKRSLRLELGAKGCSDLESSLRELDC